LNKRLGYDSDYYHNGVPHPKIIGLQPVQYANSRENQSTLGKKLKLRVENILVVPILIIFREWRRIHLRDIPEFILVLNVMVATRLRLAIRNYRQNRYY
jgi:hypothetical protein